MALSDSWRKTFCLTRLGFGLNVAPKIMTAIVNKVLAADDQIRSATDSYIDDIVVNEDKVAADQVVEHLRCHSRSWRADTRSWVMAATL